MALSESLFKSACIQAFGDTTVDALFMARLAVHLKDRYGIERRSIIDACPEGPKSAPRRPLILRTEDGREYRVTRQLMIQDITGEKKPVPIDQGAWAG